MYDYRVMEGNPFASFLKAAWKMLNIAGSCESIDSSDRAAYARNADERNFCEDALLGNYVPRGLKAIAFFAGLLYGLKPVPFKTPQMPR